VCVCVCVFMCGCGCVHACVCVRAHVCVCVSAYALIFTLFILLLLSVHYRSVTSQPANVFICVAMDIERDREHAHRCSGLTRGRVSGWGRGGVSLGGAGDLAPAGFLLCSLLSNIIPPGGALLLDKHKYKKLECSSRASII